jgi:hypothetical protein
MAATTTSHLTTATARSTSVGWSALRGAVLGVGASLAMAAFAMMAAATYQASGFFTPLYHIASTLLSPETMMTSMAEAAGGNLFFFAVGPAVLGAAIHMMIGAMYGAVFAVVAGFVGLRGSMLVAGAALWGAVVFAVSTFVALPLAASLLGSGDQVADMASMVGYPTFLAEHVLFGLALGLLLARRPARNR